MLDCSDSARGGYGAALSSELEYGNSVCVWGGGGGVTKHKCSVACAASGGGERGRRPERGERAHGRALPATGSSGSEDICSKLCGFRIRLEWRTFSLFGNFLWEHFM